MDVTLSPRARPATAWTGGAMIVWGGSQRYAGLGDGARYNPATDTWTPTAQSGAAPEPTRGFSSAATPAELFVWGGERMTLTGTVTGYANSGARLDFAARTWTPLSTANAPAPRANALAVWTGAELLVWGGQDASGPLASGGRYNPSTNSWAALNPANAPEARLDATAVWTGNHLIVWGGRRADNVRLNNGALYDPLGDTWQPVSLNGAPSARNLHAAVWTGAEMIVAGGNADGSDSGGRYNPLTNSWTALPSQTLGARLGAVWTGSELLLWGSSSVRYTPATNTWQALALPGSPWPRHSHSTVWTGRYLVVWGGIQLNTTDYVAHGGIYDPAANSWEAIADYGLLTPRANAAAAWTGDRLLLWGGYGPLPNSMNAYETRRDGAFYSFLVNPAYRTFLAAIRR